MKVGVCEARINGRFCSAYSENLTEFKDEELGCSFLYCENCAQSLRSSYTVELVLPEPETVEPVQIEEKKKGLSIRDFCKYCSKRLSKEHSQFECGLTIGSSSNQKSNSVDNEKWTRFNSNVDIREDLVEEGEEIEE